jgi:hypothetical protein
MEKYIKVTNTSDGVNRIALEKLGLSTKRNDPSTIGQFGSGIKYAPISALRKGLDFVFCGNDDNGSYQLRYSKRNENGVECVVYDYGDYTKESSFTVDAGVLSWEDDFQIYREVISNAKDGGNWRREIVDEITLANAGEFSVYITASVGMMDIYNNHNKYFCEDQTVLYNHSEHRKILEKIDDSTRIYVKTVLAFEMTPDDCETPSMFNYELNVCTLDEARTIKNQYSMESEIVQTLVYCNDKELIDRFFTLLFSNHDQMWWETTFSSWSYMKLNAIWKDYFIEKYGEKAVIVPSELLTIPDIVRSIKMRGYRPLVCNYQSLCECFERSAFPNAISVFGENIKYQIQDDITKYPNLVQALKIAASYEPGLKSLSKPIGVFSDDDNGGILGITTGMSKDVDERQILIEQSHSSNGTIPDLIGTIIHEYDHLSSGVGDTMYQAFRNIADKRIGKMMAEQYKETIVTSRNGLAVVKVNDLSMLGGLDFDIEYFKPFSCHLMRLGKLWFSLEIDGPELKKSGVATVAPSGDELYVKIGCDFSIKRLD